MLPDPALPETALPEPPLPDAPSDPDAPDEPVAPVEPDPVEPDVPEEPVAPVPVEPVAPVVLPAALPLAAASFLVSDSTLTQTPLSPKKYEPASTIGVPKVPVAES